MVRRKVLSCDCGGNLLRIELLINPRRDKWRNQFKFDILEAVYCLRCGTIRILRLEEVNKAVER